MKKILCAVIFVLCISNVQAIVTIKGSGNISCGTYLKEKEIKPTEHYVTRSWIMGFLSGTAAANSIDILKNIDVNAVEGAVTKYCQENPLQDVYDATVDVYFQLKKRMK